MNKGWLAGLAIAVVAGGTMLMPKPAEAYWVRGYGWGWHRPVVVVPGPVVVAPRYAYAPYRHHWIPAHYNRFGSMVPGHWV